MESFTMPVVVFHAGKMAVLPIDNINENDPVGTIVQPFTQYYPGKQLQLTWTDNSREFNTMFNDRPINDYLSEYFRLFVLQVKEASSSTASIQGQSLKNTIAPLQSKEIMNVPGQQNLVFYEATGPIPPHQLSLAPFDPSNGSAKLYVVDNNLFNDLSKAVGSAGNNQGVFTIRFQTTQGFHDLAIHSGHGGFEQMDRLGSPSANIALLGYRDVLEKPVAPDLVRIAYEDLPQNYRNLGGIVYAGIDALRKTGKLN